MMAVTDVLEKRPELTRIQLVGLLGGLLLALSILPHVLDDFFAMNAIIFIFIFTIWGQGWNLLSGYGGQVSLGHAIFIGVGAYTTAILFLFYGVPPVIGIWIGGLVAAIVGLLIGLVSFKLRYHYFAMATLAFALIFRTVFARWNWIGGSAGLEFPFDAYGSYLTLLFFSQTPYYYLIGAGAIASTYLIYVIDRSKLGIYLQAIKMDQELAQNAGIPVFRYKMYAMGISAYLTGFGGGLYALYIGFIDPFSTMELLRNVDPLIGPLVGGVGTVFGPVVGAIIMVPVLEYSRTYLSGQFTGLGWVVFGLVIILLAIYRPNGLLGKRRG